MATKNRAAVSLGRKGGKKRAQNLSPEVKKAQAQKAAEARWKKNKKEDAG